MKTADLRNLRVIELQAELKARGLETRGTKSQLIYRLNKAIGAEATGDQATGEFNLY